MIGNVIAQRVFKVRQFINGSKAFAHCFENLRDEGRILFHDPQIFPIRRFEIS